MTFGEKLWRLRERNKISQDGLAEKLGVSRQTTSNWENNNTIPDALKLKQLCEVFSVCADDLLSDDAERLFPDEETVCRKQAFSEGEIEIRKETEKAEKRRKAILFGIFASAALLFFAGGLIGLLIKKQKEEPPVVSSAFIFSDTFCYVALIGISVILFAAGLMFYFKKKK